MMFFYSSTEGT